ncbi:7982_t:CDS:2, partial [Acaulospora colombiana]
MTITYEIQLNLENRHVESPHAPPLNCQTWTLPLPLGGEDTFMSLAHPFYLFRIALLGEDKVGKTCILRRFTDDTFSEDYQPTIACDFATRVVEVKVQIDLSSSPRYEIYVTSWLKDIHVDLTSLLESFHGLTRRLERVEEIEVERGRTIPRLLIGNKIDLTEDIAVDISASREFAKDHGMKFAQASAKTSVNVEEPILRMIERLVEQYVSL